MEKEALGIARQNLRLRTFIAVWPDLDALRQINDLVRRIDTQPQVRRPRLTPPGRMHVTLAFIGDTTGDQRTQILCDLRGMQAISNPWTLTELGTFRNTGILWLGGSSDALQEQARLVRAALTRRGLGFDSKRFRAHITIARNWTGEIPFPLPAPIICHPSKPSLVVSLRDKTGRLHYISLSDDSPAQIIPYIK